MCIMQNVVEVSKVKECRLMSYIYITALHVLLHHWIIIADALTFEQHFNVAAG